MYNQSVISELRFLIKSQTIRCSTIVELILILIIFKMDKQVREFLLEEKISSTDHSHKCVAKKFHTWLLECGVEKMGTRKITLSGEQNKANRE